MQANITSNKSTIRQADAVILPGVGAFGDAMSALQRLDLVSTIHDVVESGKLLVGICLGLQLLFSRSHEFGIHKGLGILEGDVIQFRSAPERKEFLKIPQVCWNKIRPRYHRGKSQRPKAVWSDTLLDGIMDGTYMYFVHSFYAVPRDKSIILAESLYGGSDFCAAVRKDNVTAFQFHPERSGKSGLAIYENLYKQITQQEEARRA